MKRSSDGIPSHALIGRAGAKAAMRIGGRCKSRRLVLGGILAILLPTGAQASENGLSHYPNGVNTVLTGILPAPGDLQFFSYSQYYDVTGLPGENGKPVVPDFKADIKVEAPRLVYTYPVNISKNIHLSSGIITTFVGQSINAAGHRDSATGFADIDIEPLYVTYANDRHNFFIYGGMDIWAPTGSYNKNRLANLGYNYWTFAPDIFMTWFPNPKVEISTAIVSEFNTTNSATHYHSGSAINIDQSVHLRPFDSLPKLRLAVQGYWHQQLGDDTVDGMPVDGGFKGREFGIGPQIEYDLFKKGGILFKYDREVGVVNRPAGNRFWFELTFPVAGP